MPQIVRQMPGQRAAAADHTVLRHRGDQREPHGYFFFAAFFFGAADGAVGVAIVIMSAIFGSPV